MCKLFLLIRALQDSERNLFHQALKAICVLPFKMRSRPRCPSQISFALRLCRAL